MQSGAGQATGQLRRGFWPATQPSDEAYRGQHPTTFRGALQQPLTAERERDRVREGGPTKWVLLVSSMASGSSILIRHSLLVPTVVQEWISLVMGGDGQAECRASVNQCPCSVDGR